MNCRPVGFGLELRSSLRRRQAFDAIKHDYFPMMAVAILLGCGLSVTTPASAGAAKSGTPEGTFVGIEQGDYALFLMKDKKGRDDSFIILPPARSVRADVDNPAKLEGRRVRVQWKEQTIPEAGGLMKTVVKVE